MANEQDTKQLPKLPFPRTARSFYEMHPVYSADDVFEYKKSVDVTISELQKKTAELEKERDALIVFSSHLINCHKEGVKCLVDHDYSEYVAKRDIEMKIAGISEAIEKVQFRSEGKNCLPYCYSHSLYEFAEQLRAELSK